MWDERKQMRLHQLHETEMHGAMAAAECAELAALIEERSRHEAVAIEEAARRTEQDNASLEAQAQAVEAQNRALAALIQEQEAFLAEMEESGAQRRDQPDDADNGTLLYRHR